MGSQEKKRVRIESFTSSQALEQESKLLDLGNALFSHLSSIINLKNVFGARQLSLRRESSSIAQDFTIPEKYDHQVWVIQQCVPIDTNGCFFYTPELVLRQLGRMQIRPADEPKSIIRLYGDDDDMVKKVKEAWDKLVLREDQQRGIARVSSTPEYDSWRANRVGKVTISPPLPREECLSSREKELQSTIETLRDQMNIIDGKRQDALIEVIRKDHEIEVLKKELKIEKEAYASATLKRAKRRHLSKFIS
ncbi:hypothetical protein Lal_00035426 [Lupinus albus]|nr:hypothetical protein Lal_00035426 [Lupinus albus]